MKRIEIDPVKTYATPANAEAAVEKLYGKTDLRYIILITDDGRYAPVFLGTEAIHHGVHFHGFCIIG